MIERELLRKYLEGDCTAEEKQLVQHYLATDPQATALLNELLDASWEQQEVAVVDEEESMAVLQQLREKLYPEAVVVPIHRKLSWYLLRVAAVLVLAAISAFYFVHRSAPVQQVAAVVTWDSFFNTGNTAVHITLPDSSTAWVSPHSRLYWNMHAAANERQVRLEGEAFFDVTHDVQHPFLVHTGSIATHVLGTAFNIEAYRDESAVRISLVRGKVAVEKMDQQLKSIGVMETLSPGEMASYHKADSSISKEQLRIRDIEQWTKGYLVLNDVLLPDALERIAARSNISITYSDKIKSSRKRVTTVFRNESTGQMLDIIGFITGCKYRSTTKGLEIF
ncbi:MAG: FecR domain-containing protein [Chitinophagaceae bacterium]